MPLPIDIDKAAPADANNPSAGAASIRDLKDFLESVFGLSDATNYTVAPFSITTVGVVTVAVAGMKLQDGTAAAPSAVFSGATTTGLFRDTTNVGIGFSVAGAQEAFLSASAFGPSANDGSALGTTTLSWSDLFLASGAVINIGNGELTLTATDANTLTLAGGSLVAPTIYGGVAADGDITIEGTSHATKTTSYVILQPTAGKVGIGATGPTAQLDVVLTGAGIQEVFRLSNLQAAAADVGIEGNHVGVGNTIMGRVRSAWNGAASTDSYMSFWTRRSDSPTEALRITSAGTVGIGTATPATSALLDLSSTTGALLIPRMTTVQRDALTPSNGMILYNTTTATIQGYINGAWANM